MAADNCNKYCVTRMQYWGCTQIKIQMRATVRKSEYTGLLANNIPMDNIRSIADIMCRGVSDLRV